MARISTDYSRRQFVGIMAAGTLGASALALSACSSSGASSSASGASASASSASASASSASSSAASASGTRTIVDDAGRTVEIPAEIKSAAPSGFGARAIIYAGALDKLVGASDTDKRASVSLPYVTCNLDKFNALPSVCSGGMNNTVYEEEMITVAPDVIISTSTDPSADDELQQKLGIPVISVHMNDYDIFEEDFYKSLSMLGEVFGTTKHTDGVIEAMKEWQADLATRGEAVADDKKPTVYTGGISYRGPHGIEGTYAQYGPFDCIGAKNVVDETGKEGPLTVDMEQITVWDPEFIFLNPENMNMVQEEFANDPAFFQNLQAVKNGHVFSQPSYIAFGTNYEMAIADAYFIGKTIYPEQFEDIDIEKMADEIFETVLGSPYVSVLNEAGAGFGPITIGA